MAGHFEELDTIINKIIELIMTDSSLCKLIYYDDKEPLKQNDFDHNILMFTKIFPLPKKPNAEDKMGTMINIHFGKANPWSNSGYKKEILLIDILCHLNTWELEFGLRPYQISNRLDSLFNNKQISDISINKIFFSDWTEIQYSDYWYGYRMAFMFTNNSNVGGSL
jgi:hypothetical protein